MKEPTIRDRVAEYVLGECLPGESPDALTDSVPLISSGILNSLATVKLVAFLEDTFGIEFEPNEIVEENLNSLPQIVKFVESKRK